MSERTYTVSERAMHEIATALDGGPVELHEIIERCESPRQLQEATPGADAGAISDGEYVRSFEARFGESVAETTEPTDDYAASFAQRFGSEAVV